MLMCPFLVQRGRLRPWTGFIRPFSYYPLLVNNYGSQQKDRSDTEQSTSERPDK